MHYIVEILVDIPREKLIEIFDNPDNLNKWQPTFLGIEYVEGVDRTKGAKSRLRYKQGKGEMEMFETILVYNMPDEFSCTYEAKGVLNINKNFFYAEGDKTRWVTDTEFQFTNFLMKLMGMLLPFMFKSQTKHMMENFKKFAETGEAVKA
jgi:hypothetical protein